jgi:curved DNA-binding protein CbpA
MNPYLILGIPPGADDQAVRRAYLTLTATHPPDRFPEKFARIREAFDLLKDEESRARYKLFHTEPGAATPIGVVAAYGRDRPERTPVPESALMELVRYCMRRELRKER